MLIPEGQRGDVQRGHHGVWGQVAAGGGKVLGKTSTFTGLTIC
jgi:hypothetical protein